jgi:hypothetical protein
LKVQGDALNKLQWEQEVLQQRFAMVNDNDKNLLMIISGYDHQHEQLLVFLVPEY